MPYRLLLLFLLWSGISRSQDSLTIYYSNGEYQLNGNERQRLDRLVSRVDFTLIDSITVYGFADPTGRVKRNLKLSQKRAKSVANYLGELTRQTVPVNWYAKGEEHIIKKTNSNHRRVEVHLYLPADSSDMLLAVDSIQKDCYIIAQDVLSQCSVTSIKQGNKKLVVLEIEPHQLDQEIPTFSISAKNRTVKPIKWKMVNTGFLWWERVRCKATIKEEDFEKYGLLKQQTKSEIGQECTICINDVAAKWAIKQELGTDVTIMQNLEIRKKFLSKKYLLIAPSDYVSASKTYYLDSMTDYPIQWEYKRGQYKAPFAFAEVPSELIDHNHWSIYSYRASCSNLVTNYFYPEDTIKPHFCPPVSSARHKFGISTSYLSYGSSDAQIAGYYIYYWRGLEHSFDLGINTMGYFSLFTQQDAHFIYFDPFKERMLSGTNHSINHEYHKTASLYFGFSDNLIIGGGRGIVFQELHLGFDLSANVPASGLDKFFIQGGFGFDYLANPVKPTGTMRIGLRFRI